MNYLKEKVEVHDLRILGCYLHPFLQEMEFVSHISRRNEYRSRDEAMERTLTMPRNREKDNSQSSDIDSECSDTSFNINSLSSSSRRPVAKKRKFNLAEFADSQTSIYPNTDEVARYEGKHLHIPAGDRDVESGEYNFCALFDLHRYKKEGIVRVKCNCGR